MLWWRVRPRKGDKVSSWVVVLRTLVSQLQLVIFARESFACDVNDDRDELMSEKREGTRGFIPTNEANPSLPLRKCCMTSTFGW